MGYSKWGLCCLSFLFSPGIQAAVLWFLRFLVCVFVRSFFFSGKPAWSYPLRRGLHGRDFFLIHGSLCVSPSLSLSHTPSLVAWVAWWFIEKNALFCALMSSRRKEERKEKKKKDSIPLPSFRVLGERAAWEVLRAVCTMPLCFFEPSSSLLPPPLAPDCSPRSATNILQERFFSFHYHERGFLVVFCTLLRLSHTLSFFSPNLK